MTTGIENNSYMSQKRCWTSDISHDYDIEYMKITSLVGTKEPLEMRVQPHSHYNLSFNYSTFLENEMVWVRDGHGMLSANPSTNQAQSVNKLKMLNRCGPGPSVKGDYVLIQLSMCQRPHRPMSDCISLRYQDQYALDLWRQVPATPPKLFPLRRSNIHPGGSASAPESLHWSTLEINDPCVFKTLETLFLPSSFGHPSNSPNRVYLDLGRLRHYVKLRSGINTMKHQLHFNTLIYISQNRFISNSGIIFLWRKTKSVICHENQALSLSIKHEYTAKHAKEYHIKAKHRRSTASLVQPRSSQSGRSGHQAFNDKRNIKQKAYSMAQAERLWIETGWTRKWGSNGNWRVFGQCVFDGSCVGTFGWNRAEEFGGVDLDTLWVMLVVGIWWLDDGKVAESVWDNKELGLNWVFGKLRELGRVGAVIVAKGQCSCRVDRGWAGSRWHIVIMMATSYSQWTGLGQTVIATWASRSRRTSMVVPSTGQSSIAVGQTLELQSKTQFPLLPLTKLPASSSIPLIPPTNPTTFYANNVLIDGVASSIIECDHIPQIKITYVDGIPCLKWISSEVSRMELKMIEGSPMNIDQVTDVKCASHREEHTTIENEDLTINQGVDDRIMQDNMIAVNSSESFLEDVNKSEEDHIQVQNKAPTVMTLDDMSDTLVENDQNSYEIADKDYGTKCIHVTTDISDEMTATEVDGSCSTNQYRENDFAGILDSADISEDVNAKEVDG
ncbi:hypothetical protein RND71_015721 [Anisodus tanguticus]|uniref:Uncharacterized protein n=1 Tax=Anisodus tanguticus TaxID=243964 RepID=A0AAE1S647_9SOLA|nr:hypothetical protein RND71_015721 [Anisodus tanguticus]